LVDLSAQEIRFSRVAELGSEDSLPDAINGLAEQLLTFLQVEVLGLSADRNLRPWISLRNRNIQAVKAFMQASRYMHRAEGGAEVYLRRSIELDAYFVAPRVWLIPSLAAEGRMDEARTQLEELWALEQDANPFEQEMIAYIDAYLKNDLPSKVQHLELALTYSPQNYILLTNLAGSLFALESYEKAVEAMAPMVRARWSYPPLYFLWGLANVRLDRFEASRVELERAASRPPVNAGVYGLLEGLSLHRGATLEASRYRASLEARLAETDQDSRMRGVRRLLGEAFALLGDDALDSRREESALALLGRAVDLADGGLVELGATSAQTHRRLGEICEERGELPAAVRHYQRSLSLGLPPRERDLVRDRLTRIGTSPSPDDKKGRNHGS
jgi:tetratricopeptide (TPR) repeat protein